MNAKKIQHPILYIDDEEDNLTVFSATFRRDYEVHLATSGHKGLEIMKKHNIHLVITDQRMPKMTGTEFLEKIIPNYPDCIRMVLTGFSDVEAIIQAINKGRVYRYITKPWNKEEFKITLDRALEAYNLKVQNKNLIKDLKEANQNLEQKVVKRTKQIKQQKDEIKLQNEELQITLENLRKTQMQLIQAEKMASLGQLVAGIAHEINNPVTFISAGVDSLYRNIDEVSQVLDIYHRITPNNVEERLIEIEKLKEKIEYKETIREIYKLIDSVKTGTERTTEIVKGLRTFSRLDEDVLKIADIHDGLDSTLILLRNKYKERIEIKKHYGDIPELECYPGQLNQVFMNILSNAVDAMDEKGTITIDTSKSNESIRISIKDTGGGIPENIQSKIFEPFFTTKEVGKGTGLGLSICHSIIEKHSGSIEVKSQVGKGSEFVIVLPVKQSK